MPAAIDNTPPAYRFDRSKDRLIITPPDAPAERIGGWSDLRALQRQDERFPWMSFTPAHQLIRPYRPVKKKQDAKKAPTAAAQLGFDFGDALPARTPQTPATLSLPQQRKRAFDAYRFSFPKEVARAVDRFRSHQWPLLHALRRQPRLIDLALSNPVLFYLFVQHYAEAAIANLLPDGARLSQNELAELLGFPGTRSSSKILRKIAPESVHGENWQAMRGLLSTPENPAYKHLQHLPAINLGTLQILTNEHLVQWITPTFLEEVASIPAERHRATSARLLEDFTEMHWALFPDRNPRQISSLTRLRELHDEIAPEFIRRGLANNQGSFPRQPIPNLTDTIIALRSPKELESEGKAQDNCVATYAKRVEKGGIYIYKVLRPQRATLSITRLPSGRWDVAELEARSNTPAKPTTRRVVREWMNSYLRG